MPTNKNALLRYQVLDRCFSDFHKKYEIDDLLDKVNEALYDLYGTEVSIRQIRDDIKYMRDRVTYNAPIVAYPYDGKKCFYRYEDRNFSIFNNELSTQEISTLRSTIEMLSKFRDGSKNAWLEEVISNLEIRFGVKANTDYAVAFDTNEQLKGLEHLSALIEATVNHQPLKLYYKNFKGREEITTIHPYHLKQYNNRWFLFGLEENDGTQRIANRALDRIVKFSLANTSYIPNTQINFIHYFDEVIGVSVPSNDVSTETVTLKFDEERYPYVISKPIHTSQKVVDDINRIIQIEVKPTRELESQILFFCPHVEVLTPESLRLSIAEKLLSNYKKYSSVHIDCTDNK